MANAVVSAAASSEFAPRAPTVNSNTADMADEDTRPLIAISWSDMQITAKLVTNSAPPGGANMFTERYQVYPKLDDRLPHRGIVKARKNVTATAAAMAQMQAMRRKTPAPPQLAPPPPPPEKPGLGAATARAAPVPINAHPAAPASSPPKMSNGNAASGGQKLKRCPICNAGFNKGTYLKRHIASHSQNKPHKCDICGWGFHQYCNLKRHYASHAAGPGAGFQCLHCPASFSTKSVLSVHMREAHGDKYPTKKFLASANKQQQMQQKAGQSQQHNATNGAPHAIAPDNAASAGVKRSPVAAETERETVEEQRNIYNCSVCAQAFDKIFNLNKHMKAAHPEKFQHQAEEK